jgi:hemolysin D
MTYAASFSLNPLAAPLIPAPVTIAYGNGLDWSDTTQDLLETLPQGWSRGFLYLMVGFTAIALPWSMTAQVDEIGQAQGRLEPKGKTWRLDAAVSGTVKQVPLREGQVVRVGQKLMELESETIRADLQQSQAKLEGQISRLSQLELVRNQLELTLRTQELQRRTQAAEQQTAIDQAQNRLIFHATELQLAKQLLAQDQDRLRRFQSLQAEGAIARIQVQDVQRTVLETQQRIQQVRANTIQTDSELSKQRQAYQRILGENDLTRLETQRQLKELQGQRIALQSEMRQTENQIRSLQYQWKQRIIYAPVSGTVFKLPVQNAGAVVQPGQLLAQIAPQGVPLVLRAQISSRESGFLRVGLPVKLKFDAYPFQDYGIVQGKITWISPDSQPRGEGSTSSTGQPSNGEEVYNVEVAVPAPYIQTPQGQRVTLTPGQTAKAEIIIRQRKVLDLITAPFQQFQKNGLSL